MRRFLLILCATGCMSAQQDPTELLRRVQKKVSESLDRVPRYMCTETVDRSQFELGTPATKGSCDDPNRPAPHLTTSDRLRLDVAMAPHGEMYSWVGASRFDDGDLFEIVGDGALSTGSFAAFLTAIFRDEDVSFTYVDEKSGPNGRMLSEYGFQVPYERSHYYYGDEHAHRVVTGYGGVFLVDSRTADLVHLYVRSLRLPPETAACYVSTSLDYLQVNMKGVDFLLPAASLLVIDNLNGARSENRTVFSGCHEFLGQSTISFGDASHNAGPSSPNSAPSAFPPHLPFKIALTQDFDLTSAAAGDPVKAKLMTPIKDGRQELAPAGAIVGGRIVRLRHYQDQAAIVLEVKLETVNLKGVAVPLTASPDAFANVPKDGKPHREAIPLGTLRGIQKRAAMFNFKGSNLVFLKTDGMESDWQTTKP